MKLIFHCGSSKNGSTALQYFLLENRSALAERGIVSLISAYADDIPVSTGQLFELNKLNIYSEQMLTSEQIRNCTTSFGISYEPYKQYLFNRDINSLKKLWSKLIGAVDKAATENASVVVISAEAFETSLCLKDPYFKKMLMKFSKVYDVEVVYYKLDRSKHAVASWLQWGWIESTQYVDWIWSFLHKTTRQEFFRREAGGVGYFANLLDSPDWVDYWLLVERIRFRMVIDEFDIVAHFVSSVLCLNSEEADLIHELTLSMRNEGWPKSMIVAFPFFFGFFCQDFAKFDVIRQLLRDKEAMQPADITTYNEVLRLTSEIFDEIFSGESSEESIYNERLYREIAAL